MQIINGPITNYLFLFIKAEPQFIKAETQTNALIVQMIHSHYRKIRIRNSACLVRRKIMLRFFSIHSVENMPHSRSVLIHEFRSS